MFSARDTKLALKVAAPPVAVFEVGAEAWIEIDPKQMVPIS